MNRHLSRMVAMQTLYEWDFREGSDLEEILDRNVSEYSGDVEKEYVDQAVRGVIKDIPNIDKEIALSAPEWPLEQISLIDKTILRLAIFELLQSVNVPPKVCINEAVELSKQFGGENSSKFINGVLGTVYERHEAEIKKAEKKG